MTYCDHFTVYTYIKSLYCTSETNTMLYVNCNSIKVEKKKEEDPTGTQNTGI